MAAMLDRIGRKVMKYADELQWRLTAAGSRGYRKYRLPDYAIFLDIAESPQMLERSRGRYEPPKQHYIRQFLKAGMVFVDVGANKGDFTLLAASLVGGTGRVYAIEPEPENCRWLARSIEENGFANVQLVQAAASDTAGEATLYLGPRSGWHTLLSGRQPGDLGAVQVATIPLDELLGDTSRLDLVKIDVEGAENSVIAGATQVLRRFRPTILIDTHPEMGVDLQQLETHLRALGYRASRIDRPAVLLDTLPSRSMDLLLRPVAG
jgi:FkbM family methyltransferase